MAAQERQPEASSVDISVERRGDVDVVVHNVTDMSSHEDIYEQSSVEKEERKMETQRQAWFENAIKDKLKIPNSYAEVSVLIVRWHPDLDEYNNGHSDEVSLCAHSWKIMIKETTLTLVRSKISNGSSETVLASWSVRLSP